MQICLTDGIFNKERATQKSVRLVQEYLSVQNMLSEIDQNYNQWAMGTVVKMVVVRTHGLQKPGVLSVRLWVSPFTQDSFSSSLKREWYLF